MVYTEFPLNVNLMGLLTEREIIQSWTEKICKEILNDNIEPSDLLDILICTLFNSKGDNFKIVQLPKAVIWDRGPIRKQTKRILDADTSEPHLKIKWQSVN